jgi:hypothetical protein
MAGGFVVKVNEARVRCRPEQPEAGDLDVESAPLQVADQGKAAADGVRGGLATHLEQRGGGIRDVLEGDGLATQLWEGRSGRYETRDGLGRTSGRGAGLGVGGIGAWSGFAPHFCGGVGWEVGERDMRCSGSPNARFKATRGRQSSACACAHLFRCRDERPVPV